MLVYLGERTPNSLFPPLEVIEVREISILGDVTSTVERHTTYPAVKDRLPPDLQRDIDPSNR